MATVDIYAITDKLDDTLLKVLATRLEARGQHPRFQAMLTEYLDAMNIDVASTILDIGCGTGVAARAIARRKGFTGRVTGIDLSAGLVQVAERLSRTEGVSERIQFVVGDTRLLDIPDETFDAVVAHTLVSHVDDPLLVVKEAARVVKRGETFKIARFLGLPSYTSPPETRIHSPVIQPASSEQKSTAAAAISSGSPSRRRGVIAAIWLRNSGVIKPSSSSPSVFTMPGLIALTRMPLGPSSNASVAVIASTAALLPPYTAEPAAG